MAPRNVLLENEKNIYCVRKKGDKNGHDGHQSPYLCTIKGDHIK